MSIGLGRSSAMNMDSHRGRQLVAFGHSGECHVYHLKRVVQKPGQKPLSKATQRKPVKTKEQEKAERHAEGQTGGIDNFVTQRQAVFKTDSKRWQRGVRFSPCGTKLACAGSDGCVIFPTLAQVLIISNLLEPIHSKIMSHYSPSFS